MTLFGEAAVDTLMSLKPFINPRCSPRNARTEAIRIRHVFDTIPNLRYH